MSAPAGYTLLPTGNYVKNSDGSGPYVFDGSTMTLAATSTGSGGGGGGGGAATIADGADVAEGAVADAVVAAGAAGTVSAKLRAISRDVGTVAAAHGAVATAAAIAVSPATDSAAFPTSLASGKVASGAFAAGSVAAGAGVDGWDLTQGAIADAVVAAGATGSISAKLRAISRDIGTVAAAHGAVATAAAIAVSPATDAAAFPVSLASGKVASGAFASGALASGSVASGAIASGAIASGAVASGAVAAGALVAGSAVDGWDLTQGAIADAVVAAGATGSISAKLRAISRDLVANIVLAAGTALIGKVGIDQTTPGTTNLVSTTSGRKVRTAITRPANATPYTANDVVGATAAAITIAAIGPANGHVIITSIDLIHEVTSVPVGMTSFRLYVYGATPPSALADNAAFDLAAGDLAAFAGFIDFGVISDLGSNLYVQTDNVLKHFVCDASGNLYAYLVTNGGWTPGANSTVFDLTMRSVAA